MNDNKFNLENFEEIIEQSINKSHSDSLEDSSEDKGVNVAQKIYIIVFVFSLVALVWSSLATLEITVSTRGEALLDSDIEKVQHLEGGMLLALYVSPGDIVYKGQKIAELKAIDKENELEVTNIEVTGLSIENVQYSALLSDGEADFSAYSAYPKLVRTHKKALIEERNKNTSDDAQYHA